MNRTDVTLEWPRHADEQLRHGCHRVIAAVVALGGAVGWLRPPSRQETDAWLDGILAGTASGRGGLVVARVGGEIAALGAWQVMPVAVMRHVAEVVKIMAHPEARGLGLGRSIVTALVDACQAAGIEIVTLGVRGNNHGAIELYESCGFRTWGVVPNGIAVGDERFDDVRMYRPLTVPPGISLHGSAPGGPGGSPRRTAP